MNRILWFADQSGARSARATEILEGKGFHVSNMVGGMLSWEGEVQY